MHFEEIETLFTFIIRMRKSVYSVGVCAITVLSTIGRKV